MAQSQLLPGHEVRPLSKLQKDSTQRFGILPLTELLETLGNKKVNHFGE